MIDPRLLPCGTPGRQWHDLTGHVSVVTGGNSGIGLGLAAGLVSAGASVCIWGTDRAKNAAALERLGGDDHAWALQCDVTDEGSVVSSMETVAARFGRLDSCFINAGVSARTVPLVETSLDEFRRVLAINLDGAFVTMREAARHMVKAGNGGSLVLTSSLAVRFGMARAYSYAASKAAMVALAKAAAVELAPHGVRANALLPGWTETGLTADTLFVNDRFVENVMPRMPVRRWGVPADFAAIAVFLASPGSSFQTGDSLLLDGGYAAY